MYFVDNNSGVPVMPSVKPVSSATPQYFTEGGNGVPPTYPGPDWFNIIQTEILNILKEAGISPDKANHAQMLAAMKLLFAANTASLGALAALTGAANKLPYFTGPKGATITDLTQVGRDIIGKDTVVSVREYLGLSVLVHDLITSWMKSPNNSYGINVNNDGVWGCGIVGSGGFNPLGINAGGTGATTASAARKNLHAPSGVDEQVSSAWTSFEVNGGVVSGIGGYNISAITRLGVGAYRVNFITPLSTDKYSICGTGSDSLASGATVVSLSSVRGGVIRTTAGFEFTVRDSTDNQLSDATVISIHVFGGI